MSSNPAAGLGHNEAPQLINEEAAFEDRLAASHKKELDRFAELIGAAERAPLVVNDDLEAQRLVDWIAEQVRPALTGWEKTRTTEGEPYLVRKRWIDRFFKTRAERLQAAVKRVQNVIDAYHAEKTRRQRAAEEAARRKAAEEERQRRAEAERIEAEARKVRDAAERARLEQAAQDQREKADLAHAKSEAASQPVYLRGSYGATVYEKKNWTFYIADPAVLPQQYWKPDEDAIKAALNAHVKAHGSPPEIPGVVFEQEGKVIVKRC